MQLAVELKGVSFAYPGGPEVLSGVDLEIRRGEFVTIAGPNGGGKTTLLRVALGLEEPAPARRASSASPPTASATATGSGISLTYPARDRRAGDRERGGDRRPRRASRAPEAVRPCRPRGDRRRDLARRPQDKAATPIQRLSGGQQQRAFIAKALAGEPELLVLDEPTAGVDVDAQEAFGAFLGELHEALGVTILYVSHEFGAVERFVERVILVRGGIVFDGPPAELPAHWHDPSHVHP